MATYTENYNLKMPSGQDAPDVEDFNANAEIIDTVLKAHSDNTADEYSPDETYTAGRLVIQNNALWKAKQDINVAEAWTPAHWDPTTLAAELSAVNSSLSNLDSSKAEFLGIANITPSTVNQPLEVIKENWNDMPDGIFLTRIKCGTAYAAIIQRLDDGAYGSALILGYSLSAPLFYKCNSGTWS